MTDILDYALIKTSDFKSLAVWDYYSLSIKGSIRSKFPIVPLSHVLQLRKETIKIEDNKQYKRCRVQLYAKGVVLRDIVYGKDIKTKRQQVCKSDDFLVAEIDAKFGGYGIVSGDLADAIVSSHYFLFTINREKLLPLFLSILLRFEQFSKQVRATGSTNYAAIRPYHVLSYLIPLPSLEEQKKLIAGHQSRISKSIELEHLAGSSEDEIETRLLKNLEIKLDSTPAVSTNLQIIPYKDSGRWAVDYLLRINSLTDLRKGKYDVCSVREFTLDYQYGLSEKANKIEKGIPIVRMNNIVKGELILDDRLLTNLQSRSKTWNGKHGTIRFLR